MRYLLLLAALLPLIGCAAKAVDIQDSAELLPKDAALEYLASEEVMGHAEAYWMCVFSSAGMHMYAGFTPYEDLKFSVRQLLLMKERGYQVGVYRKGGVGGCVPYWGPDNNNQLNKVATALSSLGIEYTGKKMEDSNVQK